MVALNKVYIGQTLYDRHNYRNGANQPTIGEWLVRVISIDPIKKGAMCSWNGNSATWYSEKNLGKLHLKSKSVKRL